ncbi:MAG: hypothetical protein PVI38_19670 [Desulfobacterales bacterium]|jgi:uncharacterized protein (DUF1501 family)
MNGMINSTLSRREFSHLPAAATAALSVDWMGVKALAAAIEPQKDFPLVVIGGGLQACLDCGAQVFKALVKDGGG